MARNKFFNVNLRDSSSQDKENNISTNQNNVSSKNDYNDQINLPDKKDTGDTIDINNPVVKIFLILLGLFCILGTAYYVFQWFSS